ncbi:HNH endonuclease [Vibrio alginolyticus]|nr:HNH endonuclease [Vibrio alginolyticus]
MYSGKIYYNASDLDIDHIVLLSWAWKHGADQWTKDTRKRFANDPRNLVAVGASLNRSKGDKGLDEWLPPANQKQYRLRFQRIVKLYGLN